MSDLQVRFAIRWLGATFTAESSTESQRFRSTESGDHTTMPARSCPRPSSEGREVQIGSHGLHWVDPARANRRNPQDGIGDTCSARTPSVPAPAATLRVRRLRCRPKVRRGTRDRPAPVCRSLDVRPAVALGYDLADHPASSNTVSGTLPQQSAIARGHEPRVASSPPCRGAAWGRLGRAMPDRPRQPDRAILQSSKDQALAKVKCHRTSAGANAEPRATIPLPRRRRQLCTVG